jgi:opacity protein-like surface antigen
MQKTIISAVLALGVLFAPVAAQAQPAQQEAIKRNGFFLQFQLGTNFQSLSGLGANTVGLPMVQAGFVLGYKINRILVGLRLDVGYAGEKTTDEAGGDKSTHTESNTTLILAPTFQFHLFEKGPLALYLSASFDIGPVLQRMKDVDITGDETTENDDLLAVGFTFGLGMRYFFTSHFGISVEAGLRGLWVIDTDDYPSLDAKQTATVGTLSAYGQLGMIAVW